MAGKVEEVLDIVEEMTVIELSELVEAFEERFGVSAAAPVAAAPVESGEGEDVEEEKDIFDVVLTEVGDKKIQVIKAVREVTDLGLKEAKELVDGAPSPVNEGLAKEEAEEIVAKLSDAGATAELK